MPYVKSQDPVGIPEESRKLIASKINSLLNTTLGPNNAVAQVTAEIDFDKRR